MSQQTGWSSTLPTEQLGLPQPPVLDANPFAELERIKSLVLPCTTATDEAVYRLACLVESMLSRAVQQRQQKREQEQQEVLTNGRV